MIDPAEARYVRPWNPLVLFLTGGPGRVLVAALRADLSPELFKLNLKKGQIWKVCWRRCKMTTICRSRLPTDPPKILSSQRIARGTRCKTSSKLCVTTDSFEYHRAPLNSTGRWSKGAY